jgi:xanthine dehydrogenase accessory factor
LLENRKVCRVRICFEDGILSSELLSSDALLPERRGILIDTIQLPVRLLLFGTGPEIGPITQLAADLGWGIERFDHPSELLEDFRSDTKTAALVMNHSFGRDLLALDRVLPLGLRYIGLLGPRKRHGDLLMRLGEYRPFDFEAGMKNLYRTRRSRHRQRSAGGDCARDHFRS